MRAIFFSAVVAAALLGPVGVFAFPVGEKVNVAGGSYTNVSPSELQGMLKGKDFFFVNVHIPYEGEIPSTDAFLPFDQTAERLADYPADRKAKVVLYCRSGRMSDLAARDLVKAGFTNIFNLKGGMIAWEGAGYPLDVDPARR
jgi:rhodanese-related sulfurtransferase